jgi:hypothetical protein
MNTEKEKPLNGLDLLRAPFGEGLISKLPKPTKAQTDEVRNNFKAGIRCGVCGGWHHPKVVHLDYVGHAALTDRLLDCDINWNWSPLAFAENGLPVIVNGGMWINLTVCGQTRLGFGDAGAPNPNKSEGDKNKEMIGDALRNAAMRFGAALDLWHKGDLHPDEDTPPAAPATVSIAQFTTLKTAIGETDTDEAGFLKYFKATSLEQFPLAKYDAAIGMLEKKKAAVKPNADLGSDEIQY